MPAGRLTLEITETSVVSHLAVVDRVLDELRDLGVRLALDDFGTGWSSLSHLARLPVHEVKIAAAFTERLMSSPSAAAVVRARWRSLGRWTCGSSPRASPARSSGPP